ncbi:hypothetical protein ACGFWI_12355 [Streptomyces sp. NPDC048434]
MEDGVAEAVGGAVVAGVRREAARVELHGVDVGELDQKAAGAAVA